MKMTCNDPFFDANREATHLLTSFTAVFTTQSCPHIHRCSRQYLCYTWYNPWCLHLDNVCLSPSRPYNCSFISFDETRHSSNQILSSIHAVFRPRSNHLVRSFTTINHQLPEPATASAPGSIQSFFSINWP